MPLHRGPTRTEAERVRFALDHESDRPELWDGWTMGEIVNSWDVIYVDAETARLIAAGWSEIGDPLTDEFAADLLSQPVDITLPGVTGTVVDLVGYTTFIPGQVELDRARGIPAETTTGQSTVGPVLTPANRAEAYAEDIHAASLRLLDAVRAEETADAADAATIAAALATELLRLLDGLEPR